VTETLTEIEKGLQAAPESATLLGFRDHVRKVEPLVEPLAAAESMNEPDNVDALLQNLKSCDSVMQIEEDPLNTLRRRAEAARVRIAQRLQEVSRANAAKADEVLQAGNRKEALRLYGLAMKADPTNQTVAQAFGAVRKKIVSECRALYQKGIVHEELQQLDLARNAFQEVLAIGIPGEEYYERAARKLKESAP
jgi:tetratricopeptide (TPR) repeat protein